MNGLSSRPDLNGATVQVISDLNEHGRVNVHLESNGMSMSVLLARLSPVVTPTPPAAGAGATVHATQNTGAGSQNAGADADASGSGTRTGVGAAWEGAGAGAGASPQAAKPLPAAEAAAIAAILAAGPVTAKQFEYLSVPFEKLEELKAVNASRASEYRATWDADRSQWKLPVGAPLGSFRPWLTVFPSKGATALNVPFSAKDDVKRLGATWDNPSKTWRVRDGFCLTPFVTWLPLQTTEQEAFAVAVGSARMKKIISERRANLAGIVVIEEHNARNVPRNRYGRYDGGFGGRGGFDGAVWGNGAGYDIGYDIPGFMDVEDGGDGIFGGGASEEDDEGVEGSGGDDDVVEITPVVSASLPAYYKSGTLPMLLALQKEGRLFAPLNDDDVTLSARPQYLCPISNEIMLDPVFDLSGNTYSREFISRWFEQGKLVSPLTNEPVQSALLTPNHSLRAEIISWVEEKRRSLSAVGGVSPPNDAPMIIVEAVDDSAGRRDSSAPAAEARQTRAKRRRAASGDAPGRDPPTESVAPFAAPVLSRDGRPARRGPAPPVPDAPTSDKAEAPRASRGRSTRAAASAAAAARLERDRLTTFPDAEDAADKERTQLAE